MKTGRCLKCLVSSTPRRSQGLFLGFKKWPSSNHSNRSRVLEQLRSVEVSSLIYIYVIKLLTDVLSR